MDKWEKLKEAGFRLDDYNRESLVRTLPGAAALEVIVSRRKRGISWRYRLAVFDGKSLIVIKPFADIDPLDAVNLYNALLDIGAPKRDRALAVIRGPLEIFATGFLAGIASPDSFTESFKSSVLPRLVVDCGLDQDEADAAFETATREFRQSIGEIWDNKEGDN